jgi:spore maturation protein CgeB
MFLEPEREVLVARGGEEVAARLAELTPEGARRIGKAALARVLAEHTYAHRAAQVESVLAPALTVAGKARSASQPVSAGTTTAPTAVDAAGLEDLS